MRSFIGRKAELEIFEREYKRSSGFMVLYGRRRVGKTALIKEFIKDKQALYFLASQESDLLNRQRFAQDVSSFTGQSYLAEANFSDWRPLFAAFADFDPEQKKVLIIDELPYLVKANAAFVSVLQYAWDEILSRANVMLVLCGSSVHMMHDAVLAYESPLYGRRTAQMRLTPLRFDEIVQYYSHVSFKRLLDLYAVTGGVPKYLELFDEGRIEEEADFWGQVQETVLSPAGFLYEEPRFLLDQEVSNPFTYMSILSVVARGNHKASEIAGALGRSATEISPYLGVLVNLGYLERRVSFQEKKPQSSKNGLYEIADEFIDFWFRYVRPYSSELEMGNALPSQDALRRTFRSNKVSFEFEKLCRLALPRLCASGSIPFMPSRVEGYWNRRSDVEIDVCALASEGWESPDGGHVGMLLGECKLHEEKPFLMSEFEVLEKKAQYVPGFTQGEALFCLFSATGFEKSLEELASTRNDLILVDELKVCG